MNTAANLIPAEGPQRLSPCHYESLLSLYRSMIGLPGSGWDEHYPDAAETRTDLEEGRVLGLLSPAGGVLAAITLAEGDADFNGRPHWTNPGPTVALVRLGVAPPLQGRGIGRQLFLAALEESRRRGAAGVRFMVDRDYPHAIRLYEGLGCSRVGEGSLYGLDWYFYEVNF